LAGKTPPSKQVPSGPLIQKTNNVSAIIGCLTKGSGKMMVFTYVMRASHSKKFSSFIGPAIMPSGGFSVNSVEENT